MDLLRLFYSSLVIPCSTAEIWLVEGGNYEALNTELLSDDIKKLGSTQLMYYKVLDIYCILRDPPTQIASLLPSELRRNMRLSDLRTFASNFHQSSGSTFIEYLSNFINIANNDTTGHCTQFLKSILDINRLSLTDVKQKIAGVLFPNGTESQEAVGKLDTILKLEMSVCEAWYKFIKRETHGDVVYHTYHGTKGLDFDNVIIIMGNAFGKDKNFFNYYFSHCQNQDSLTDEEKEKMTKVKNLLYVSVTRTIKNLRILYIDDTKDFEQGINSIFGEIYRF